MNDATDPDVYVNRTKLRQKDSSCLAQSLQAIHRTGSFGGLIPVILDIGCGTGYSTLELAVRFPHSRVVGIDSNPTLIDAAPVMAPNAEFYCIDISESSQIMERFLSMTDLGESSVSLAVSIYWISELDREAQSNALRNVRYLMKPDAQLHILDLIWTNLSPVIYGLNRTPKWSEIIAATRQRLLATEKHHPENYSLFETEKPPTADQINGHWLEILSRHPDMALIKVFLHHRTYDFESIDDLITVLESLCPSLELDEPLAHQYLVDFIRQSFNSCFCVTKQLILPYHCLQVTIGTNEMMKN